MDLFELCSLQGTTPPSGSVPPWTLGCFRRRSITFFNGDTDDETLVIWLQARGLTGDLRLAVDRPKPKTREALRELSLGELIRAAEVEGGVTPTRFESALGQGGSLSGTMQWPDWTGFQVHDKWPEPGNLRRVGDCLIEHAPSGAYVEDWRLQPSGHGPLIGLTLLEERDGASGQVLHRGGGLVVAGEHAMFVRGRPDALPLVTRVSDLMERATRDQKLLDLVFGFEASYARRDAEGRYVIESSTLPWREGEVVLGLGGFGLEDGVVVQRVREQEGMVLRRFQVDTLEESYEDWLATPATSNAVAWLTSEADTLLRSARSRSSVADR